jgi:hypothetical protein
VTSSWDDALERAAEDSRRAAALDEAAATEFERVQRERETELAEVERVIVTFRDALLAQGFRSDRIVNPERHGQDPPCIGNQSCEVPRDA